MVIVLSPAKTLEMGIPLPAGAPPPTQPRLLERSEVLIAAARKLSVKKLMALMDISKPLAEVNRDRFAAWQPGHTEENAHPALLVFRGDVYQGLDATSWSPNTIERAQEQLRMLSGLYGVLRPLDLIQPYRLEMGRPLKTARKKNLYQFWGDTPAKLLGEDLAASGSPILINLASEEYFKAVQLNALPAGTEVISPVFEDEVKEGYRVMGLWAKRARGMLARWALERNREIKVESDLRDFDLEGYKYSKSHSEPGAPVFRRRERDRPEKSLPRAPKLAAVK